MDDSKIAKYLEYKFFKDNNFIKYIEQVFPEPKGLLLEKFKRKYYKKTINKDFIINYDDFNKKVSEFNLIKEKLENFLEQKNNKIIKENINEEEMIFQTKEEFDKNLKRLRFLNSIYLKNIPDIILKNVF